MASRTVPLRLPVDLRVSLGALAPAGGKDPTIRLAADRLQRGWLTPDGPASLDLRLAGDRAEATAWGPGGAWLLERVPALVGGDDDLAGFAPDHPVLARAHHHAPGLRMAATGQVWDVLVPTILAQKVTGLEAARGWLGILRRWGEPAPGPLGLVTPPAPEVLAGQPYWAFHELGIERKRAEIVIEAARRIRRLEEAVAMPRGEAVRRLTACRGIGPWTAALVMRTAMGDADAVEVGDYHIKHHVCWNLAAEPRGSDERMLELLAPYAGHRGRAVRLLTVAGRRAPAFGPRTAVRDLRRLTPPGCRQ